MCDCTIPRQIGGPANCGAVSPESYRCTRPVGHDGPHRACAVTYHGIAEWVDEKKVDSAG
jgi:hypothetical protein